MHAEISEQFEELGCVPTADILDKCVELCLSYNITDAVEFVEQWMAYSISHLNGAEPTIEYLGEMERKDLAPKRDKELAAAIKKKTKYPLPIANLTHLTESNPLAIYGIDSPSTIDSPDGPAGANDDDDIVDSYICHTPKAKTAIARTPVRPSEVLFSPASYTPISGTPRAQAAVPGSGKIVYTFGNPKLISSATWSSVNNPKITVKQLLLHKGKSLSSSTGRYMFDNLREKTELVGDRVFRIGRSICEKVFGNDADAFELCQVDMHSQAMIKTIGTICCDFDGKLNPDSTLLVGSDEMRLRTVLLNFKQAKPYGVFPGQVVMVTGMNSKGDVFMVDEVIDRVVEPSAPPNITTTDKLSFVIAAGPYTNHDDLVYESMHDLIHYCKDNKPDVLILTGPFMDADHTQIHENVVLAEPFELFFEKIITGMVEAIGPETTILIVASHKDANADPVYPTFPMSIKKSYPNVHMLPDPSIVDLNGITIGITSTDVVDHILDYELASNAGDKVKRIVNYLFSQGSFYPLDPPACERMCFDSLLASEYANIEKTPNIMILPSDQKCFIRVVNGCLAINPGRLTDPNGGTFSRLVLTQPAKDETNWYNFVACQVRKV